MTTGAHPDPEPSSPIVAARGGSFLIEERTPDEIFTVEDLTEEQRMIGNTCADWMERDVLPRLPQILKLDYDALRALFRKAGEVGLLGIEISEEYGGLGLDKVSATLAAENVARDGSVATAYGAHTGIGT